MTQERVRTVEGIVRGNIDPLGDRIIKVFYYNPPYYAIYRTLDRLVVQFSSTPAEHRRQQLRISPLAPMRGQINGLIDGWHSADLAQYGASSADELDGEIEVVEPPRRNFFRWLTGIAERDQFKRASRYDRRVTDAIVTVLEDPNALETAQLLLAQVKNDILAERSSIARAQYIRWALLLTIGLVALMGLTASGALDFIHAFGRALTPAWTAVSGGAIGAFFSIAIGLKRREVAIDLQKRENRLDVILRMLIGAIAGGVLYAMLASGLVTTELVKRANIVLLDADASCFAAGCYSDLTVFLTGFVAGFLERLVPTLLNTTNFGTPEPAGQDTPVKTTPITGASGDSGSGASDGAAAEPPAGAASPTTDGDAQENLAPASTPVDDPDAAAGAPVDDPDAPLEADLEDPAKPVPSSAPAG